GAGGGPAAATPANQWLCLCNLTYDLLAVTADQGAAAIPANTRFSYPIAQTAAGPAPTYTIPATGAYYIGLCVVAATMPTRTAANLNPPPAIHNTPPP